MPPGVNGMPRVTDRNLELDGYLLPKGVRLPSPSFISPCPCACTNISRRRAQTTIACHTYTLQHDPCVWGDDVEDFRPERWLESPERTAELQKAFLPFSAGSRNCIGKRYVPPPH